jgi:hypothetical protein
MLALRAFLGLFVEEEELEDEKEADLLPKVKHFRSKNQ